MRCPAECRPSRRPRSSPAGDSSDTSFAGRSPATCASCWPCPEGGGERTEQRGPERGEPGAGGGGEKRREERRREERRGERRPIFITIIVSASLRLPFGFKNNPTEAD